MGVCLSIIDTVASGGKTKSLLAEVGGIDGEGGDGTGGVVVIGGEKEFRARFLDDRVLGEGEFGTVRMVHDIKAEVKEPLACKYLSKGVAFKNNTLYSPIKPHVLRNEVKILQALKCNQKKKKSTENNYCLQLHSLYETARHIYIVTELCAGGEMNHWVSSQAETNTELHTEDVSRISYQLLSAIAHCNKHKVIHRDIKPENIMFKDSSITAELRLIDFGSGTMDTPHTNTDTNHNATDTAGGEDKQDPQKEKEPQQDTTTTNNNNTNNNVDVNNMMHTTFAGSAFYISPEMFQKKYTEKTDIWSIGVTLYVLVAGYPAECLQKAFDHLQSKKKERSLKELPNLPSNMPETYYDMLETMLVYRHKNRASAEEILQNNAFVHFHKQFSSTSNFNTSNGGGAHDPTTMDHTDIDTLNSENIAGISLDEIFAVSKAGAHDTHTEMNTNNNSNKNNSSRTNKSKRLSNPLEGTVQRHTLFLDYKKYERSLTTLLATVLSKEEFENLIQIVIPTLAPAPSSQKRNEAIIPVVVDEEKEKDKLKVIPIFELINIVKNEIKNEKVVFLVEKLKNNGNYNTFAYHVHLLHEFSRRSQRDAAQKKRIQKKGGRDLTNPKKKSKGILQIHITDDYSNNSTSSKANKKGKTQFLRGNNSNRF